MTISNPVLNEVQISNRFKITMSRKTELNYVVKSGYNVHCKLERKHSLLITYQQAI